MIKSLSIRNIATFNNDGININNLKQINIIYGANGSGKSTIGKAIANIESYDQSSISWEMTDLWKYSHTTRSFVKIISWNKCLEFLH